jgi:hypothetical protein
LRCDETIFEPHSGSKRDAELASAESPVFDRILAPIELNQWRLNIPLRPRPGLSKPSVDRKIKFFISAQKTPVVFAYLIREEFQISHGPASNGLPLTLSW